MPSIKKRQKRKTAREKKKEEKEKEKINVKQNLNCDRRHKLSKYIFDTKDQSNK